MAIQVIEIQVANIPDECTKCGRRDTLVMEYPGGEIECLSCQHQHGFKTLPLHVDDRQWAVT